MRDLATDFDPWRWPPFRENAPPANDPLASLVAPAAPTASARIGLSRHAERNGLLKGLKTPPVENCESKAGMSLRINKTPARSCEKKALKSRNEPTMSFRISKGSGGTVPFDMLGAGGRRRFGGRPGGCLSGDREGETESLHGGRLLLQIAQEIQKQSQEVL